MPSDWNVNLAGEHGSPGSIGQTGPAGPAGGAPILNYLGGLTLSNDATTPTTVLDIAPGTACSDDGTTMMTLATAFTKNCAATWVVGSGNGGLGSAGLTPNTWYHVFLICRTDTGVVDVFIAPSLTPSLPTNYNVKRRIGSIRTAGGATILAFLQVGDHFIWVSHIQDWPSGTVFSNTLTAYVLTVPTGVRVIAEIVLQSLYSTAGWSRVQSPDDTNTTTLPITLGQNVANVQNGVNVSIQTNTSAQIMVQVDTNGRSSLQIFTFGWFDNRGK
jgi:hypothetical protein